MEKSDPRCFALDRGPIDMLGAVATATAPGSVMADIPPKKYLKLTRSLDSRSARIRYLSVLTQARCPIRRVELQRLFSTFPRGWPGVGLLLLRAQVGFMLIAHGVAYFRDLSNPGPLTLAAGGLAVATGFCLLSGFLTPLAGVLVALGSLGVAFSTFAAPALDLFDSRLIIVDMIVISISIALLGPGAFSLDALMFGRREISIPRTVDSARPK